MKARILHGAIVALALVLTAACGGSEVAASKAVPANNAVAGISTSGVQGAGSPTDDSGTPVDPGVAGGDPDTGAGDPGTTAPGAAGGTGGGAAGGAGAGGGAGDAKGKAAGAPALPGVKAASCAGFKNQVGITDSTMTLGNSSDLSGPVPGLFTAAQQGAKAYVAYFNATHPGGICGRRLVLKTYDSRTDAGADQQSQVRMCSETFAGMGSMSAFDSGGAATAEACGFPDVRATATTAARNNCSTCFGAQSTGAYEYGNALPDFFVKNYPDASQKAAFVYLNAGASAENAKTQIAVETQRGMKFVYTSPIDVADFNYGPYVQQMRNKGVEYVQFIGGYQQAVRLAQAMQQATYRPQVIHFDQTTDDPNYLKTGGSAVEGAITSLTYNPLFESGTEVDLYKKWLGQIAPGSNANGFGLFGWSAGKLFVEQALALGGGLTRASLVEKLRNVHAWTAGGLHGPMDVGGKHAATCVRFQQAKGGRFVTLGGTKFLCGGLTKVR